MILKQARKKLYCCATGTIIKKGSNYLTDGYSVFCMEFSPEPVKHRNLKPLGIRNIKIE